MFVLWGRAIAALLLLSASAYSLDADRTIDQFEHQVWRATDAAPSDIYCLSQTADGYLWIGTSAGLYRFDGVEFESFEPREGKLLQRDIRALLSTPEGGLWIGYGTGGISYLLHDKVTTYTEAEGFPYSSVHAIAFSADSRIVWASTGKGLFRFDGFHWKQAGEEWGLPNASFGALFPDPHGGLWTAAGGTVYRLRQGSSKFEVATIVGSMAPGRSLLHGAVQTDGTVWVSDFHNDKLISLDSSSNNGNEAAPVRLAAMPIQTPAAVMTDRDDTLWVSTKDGFVRLGEQGHTEQMHRDVFAAQHGVARTLFEDREGNVWAGSREGLERFSHRKVIPFPLPDDWSSSAISIAPDHDGSLWIAFNGGPHPLFHLQGTQLTQTDFTFQGPVSSLFASPEGALWVGGQDSLARLMAGKLEQLPPASGPPNPKVLSEVQTMTTDREGRLWVSIVRHGLYRLDAGRWHPNGDLEQLPTEPAMSAATDRTGRVWFGFARNRVAMIDQDHVTLNSQEQGLHLGNVTALSCVGDRVWLGGDEGLALFDGERFRMLGSWDADRIGGIKGIVATAGGDLWLSQGTGVVHIQGTAIAAKLASPSASLVHDLLSSQDGMVGQPQFRPAPTAAQTTDGRVWATSNWGLFWVATEPKYRNLLPPPVIVRSLKSDATTHFPNTPVVLAALPSNIEIAYTALSLTQPERVQFRYRLEGLEKDWQDVGTRRAAFYNRLAPGRYTFHVIASNNDGVWNTTGASLDFQVTPTFYQTTAFRVLCALLAALLLWFLYNARLRQVTRQFSLRLDERVNERTRIARELHDTLLQSFQGLILRFQAAKNLLPKQPHEADRVLQSAIERAAAALTEGRDAVQALRTSSHGGVDFLNMITQMGEEQSNHFRLKSPDDLPPQFSVTVEGVHRDLRSSIVEDIRRILSEALANAFRHSRARHIEVDIRYEPRQLCVRVRDDGVGLERQLAHDGGREGHWGLLGMRERAMSIGGRLELLSERGAGTEIGLVIPASIAYLRVGEKADSQASESAST